MQRSPTSHSTQVLITNSGKYGITKGSYQAEWLELTPDGLLACDPNAAPREQLAARFRLAIEHIAPFKQLYDACVGKRLPAREVMKDLLTAADLDATGRHECVDLFVVNVTDLGLLRQIGGAQTLVSVEAAIDALGTTRDASSLVAAQPLHASASPISGARNWDRVCFYITPIGDDDSDARRHSDMFMQSLIAPAMDELELEVVRADQIGEPGMITAQVIEHIRLSQLCIADLSLLNPNVFYEMCLRHACRRPVVQIIQKSDRLPFDLNQVNSLVIDTTSMYTFVPQIETYRAQIATLARKAIEDPTRVGNPISVFFPTFWKGIDAE